MKKQFFIRPHEFELTEDHMEKNSGELITTQGLALTPSQLLAKYEAGAITEFRVAPVFSPDPDDLDQEDLQEIRRMELEELHSRGDALQEQYDALLEAIRLKEKQVIEDSKNPPKPKEGDNTGGSGNTQNPPGTDTTT